VPGQKSGAYFKRFDDLVDEAEQYITEVVMKEDMLKGLPIFLFGISMGGATTIKLAHRAPERYAGVLCGRAARACCSRVQASTRGLGCVTPGGEKGTCALRSALCPLAQHSTPPPRPCFTL